MTLVKDDKLAAESKSKQDRRKEKKTASDPVERLKKTVEIVVEDQDLSGPSSGVREGFNKNIINDTVDVTFVTLRLDT